MVGKRAHAGEGTVEDTRMTVGEAARRTGLTVRTLHHYDEIGLLEPAERSAAGYRLYGAAELARLQMILSLRAVGLSLEEVGAALDRPSTSLADVLELHLEHLGGEIERRRTLQGRVRRLLERVRRTGEAGIDDLTSMMEAMTMFEKYYTPEQLERLAAREEEVGQERIREVQEEWKELFRALRERIDAGAGPDDDAVQELAVKARGLVREFTGGDPEIAASLSRMYREEGARAASHGDFEADPDVMAFLGAAMGGREPERG